MRAGHRGQVSVNRGAMDREEVEAERVGAVLWGAGLCGKEEGRGWRKGCFCFKKRAS